MNLPKQYDFGSVSSRTFKVEGYDHKGKYYHNDKKVSGTGDFGSLTPEEIEKYSHMLPNKSVIDRMVQNKNKRKSIFKTFNK